MQRGSPRCANAAACPFPSHADTSALLSLQLFHFWFHTAYVSNNYLQFGKRVLDKAVKVRADCKLSPRAAVLTNHCLGMQDKHHRVYPPDFSLELYLHRLPDSEAEVVRRESRMATTVTEVHDEGSDTEDEDEEGEDLDGEDLDGEGVAGAGVEPKDDEPLLSPAAVPPTSSS